MRKVGLICDLSFTKHMQFRNYYYALLALYKEIKLVHSKDDLIGLDILFVGDYFHGPHWGIVTDYNEHHRSLPYVGGQDFVKRINELDITLVLLCAERIYDTTSYQHAIPTYETLAKCKKFYHYAYDIDDCNRLCNKLHRVLMSKHYKNCVQVNIHHKKDKIVFIGAMYQSRRPTIHYVAQRLKLDAHMSNLPSWEEYMKLIGEYRFMLSPLGNANALVAKFYEALLVHTIPIQQVRSDTLKYYNIEAKFPDCIFFENIEEIPDKVKDYPYKYSQSEIWLEDYLEQLLKEDSLL